MPDDLLVIRTKLHRPALPSDLVRRQRLLDALSAHADRPLVLISAAAGYGKSTLASEWLAESPTRGAWLSLDEGDDDLRQFLAHLLAAIEAGAPSSLPRTSSMLHAEALPSIRLLAGSLADEIDRLAAPLIIVLDDMHRVTSRPVHDFLAAVLDHPPRKVRLVIASRADPPLPLARLRANGKLLEIRADALRFSSGEAMAFLSNVLGARFQPRIAEAWGRSAEGWITGLRLASLALGEGSSLPEDPFASGYGRRDAARYLLSEVLVQREPGMIDDLLRSAIPERFCPALCDSLHLVANTDARHPFDGREFVEWMEGVGLFVNPLDDERRWFRFHHLFRDLLRDEAKRRFGDAGVDALCTRACEWFESQGLTRDAFDVSLEWDNVECAADVLERNVSSLIHADKTRLLEGWLARLPEEAIWSRPNLVFARSFTRFYHWDLDEVRKGADRIETLVGGSTHSHAFAGKVALLRGMADVYVDSENGFEQLSIALEHLDDPKVPLRVRSGAYFYFGRAAFHTGRTQALERRVAEWTSDGTFPPQLEARLRLMLASNSHMGLDAVQAHREAGRLRELAAEHGVDSDHGWADYLDGLVHLRRCELDAAVERLQSAAARRHFVLPDAGADALTALSAAYHLGGQAERAEETLELLFEFVEGRDPLLQRLASSGAARLALLRGEVPERTLLLPSESASTPDVMPYRFNLPELTLFWATIGSARPAELTGVGDLLDRRAKEYERTHNALQLVTVLALRAVVHERRGDKPAAAAALGRALGIAGPAGLALPFVEFGALLSPLLERIERARGDLPPFAEWAARANRSSRAPSTTGRAAPTRGRKGLAAPTRDSILSPREHEVLCMLAEGLYQREIADRLSISSETVKTHSKRIYEKLGVHDRREAVAKGRTLALLPAR